EGVEGEELLTPGVSIEAKKYDGNITLTARWTPKKYDVTYDWNGKDEADNAAIALQNKTLLEKFNNYTYDNPVAFPQPIRAGYTFLGWTVLADGEELYEGTLYTELPAEMFSMENPRAVTLRANWKANSYTVTLNGNGATEGVAPSTIPVVFDQALNAEGVTIPTYFGYVFLGYWSCDEDGAFVKQYINGEGASVCTAWDIPADTTLYARWDKLPEVTPPTFKINYLKETIEVEGGIPAGHYVFRLAETVLDVTVDAQGKITVNRKIVSQIDIPDAFFGATIDVLVWGDGISTSNFEGKLSLAARPSAPVLLQEILGVRKDYTTIAIQMAEGLLYTYEFAISRDANASMETLVWQSVPLFENLYQGTVYYLYVRVNEAEDHPYGIAAVLEGRTEHRKYLEEKIDRLQALKQEGDGEQVDAVIAQAVRRAEELGEDLPATFYEDLEMLYQNTVLAVEFARQQDARITDLRELCAAMIATELYSEANEALLQTLCENAVASIKATDKSYEIQSIYDQSCTKMYAVKISHLTAGSMEMISHGGLERSTRLSLIFLSDFASLSDAVNDAIREGNLVYNGTATTYGGLANALRTKYLVGAYGMHLYTRDASGLDVIFDEFEGVYEFRLLLTDNLKGIEGLMVGYYNEKTGALEILDTTREGNCLVFKASRVADFVILGDPVLDLTVVIAALGAILLCQLIALILLLVRRAKASRAVKHYSFLPAFALTIRLLPANALTVVLILGALVILLQILLLCLITRSDLIRRPKKAHRKESEEDSSAQTQAEESVTEEPSAEEASAIAYAYAENGEALSEEPMEDAEEELSEDYYDTDPNNFEEDFSEESAEGDPFAVYAEDGDALSEEGNEQEGELPEKGGEEEPYAPEFAYDEEDFIEPAANPRYSLPDEEYSEFDIDPEAAEEEMPAEEVYTEEVFEEDAPTEEAFEEFSEEDAPTEEAFEEFSEEDVPAEEAFEEFSEEDAPVEEAFEELSEEAAPVEELSEAEASWEEFSEESTEELWNDSEEPKKE
ncbi:MAG: InlB B-repeat-containing protein, partial [Clostridia bacterium]|nr:InlB B-repeat-containing protein [Clostridia bacterium]